MTPTQEYLLKLVLEIDEICKKHDIEYYLEYGTMLGAVRHEGFIPWDNDFDISMTEENYDKFARVCETELDGKTRGFMDNRRDRRFPRVFGHYFDLTSHRLTGRTMFWKEYSGQWIDIFCLLELPGEKKAKQEAINRYFAYDEYVNETYRHYRWKSDEIMDLYREYQRRGEQIGKENLLQELEKEIFGHHYDDCETYMVTSARADAPTPFVPKKAYENSQFFDFEGHRFRVPGDYVELLTLFYGDDFNLFPKDKRIHPEMSHTGIPAIVYAEDFTRLIDVDEMLRERQAYKDLHVEEGYKASRLNKKFLEMEGLKERWAIESRIKNEQIDLTKLMERRTPEDIKVLEDLFAVYFEKQLHTSARYWRAHFDIGDELEYAAMYTLLLTRSNRVGIDRLFRLREQNHLPLTEDMIRLKEVVQHIRDIKKYMIYGRYDEARIHIDWGMEHFPESKEIRLWDLKYQEKHADTPEKVAACNRLADELLASYPDDGDCLKVKGDLCWDNGDREGALRYYDILEEESNDGLILLDIRKKKAASAAI